MTIHSPTVTVEMVTDPEDRARARTHREQFDRNFAWFEPRAAEIYAAHLGKHLCDVLNALGVIPSGPGRQLGGVGGRASAPPR